MNGSGYGLAGDIIHHLPVTTEGEMIKFSLDAMLRICNRK